MKKYLDKLKDKCLSKLNASLAHEYGNAKCFPLFQLKLICLATPFILLATVKELKDGYSKNA